MRLFYALIALAVALPFHGTTQADQLSIERIFSAPDLTTVAPQRIQFSPDGQHVTYLKGSLESPEIYDLWIYDVRADQHQLLLDAEALAPDPTAMSATERARRERLRIRAAGIVDYQWSPDGNHILIPLAGQLYLYVVEAHADDQPITLLTAADISATDARFSPQGNYVSFVHENNLWLVDLASNETKQLTTGASNTIQYAVAEFVAQEEMKRMTGYWWSADEEHIALTRVDLRPVAVKTRVDVYADRTELVKQRYPVAGEANAVVDLGVLQLDTNNLTWLDLPERYGDGYLARVAWVGSTQQLSYQWQNRSQNQLDLWLYSLGDQKHQKLVQEISMHWLNLHDDLVFLDDGKHFIWASERSGFKHLYLYRLDGRLIRQLTSGDWQVDHVERVDETAGLIYFTARKDTPLERHLYRASMTTTTPSQPTRLSERAGFHSVQFAANARSYVDSFSSSSQPLQVALHGPTGERIAWLHENRLDADHPLAPYLDNWSQPEFGTLNAADGQVLHYKLTKPTQFADNQRYPAIVMVYGGPRAQRVTNTWGDYFTQYLAQQGYVVFQLDNRGSGNRGSQFESGIYRQLAQLEVRDQQVGAEFLRNRPYIDPDRIGVFGHSYGGYMALHLILRADDQFAAAVAGAPVTDWALYDTHYTERYLGTPANNPDGYKQASVLTYAGQLRKPLLIYHGMADDNVLYTHTAKLTYALQQAMLPFELMAYPGKAHGLYGRETSIHRYQLIADFFDRSLKP
ncbi:MAG TPA: S9 family peptidase [Pseudidiomarina sp.]|nr:S9 family peptidase [Pseudidiomarina sp.]